MGYFSKESFLRKTFRKFKWRRKETKNTDLRDVQQSPNGIEDANSTGAQDSSVHKHTDPESSHDPVIWRDNQSRQLEPLNLNKSPDTQGPAAETVVDPNENGTPRSQNGEFDSGYAVPAHPGDAGNSPTTNHGQKAGSDFLPLTPVETVTDKDGKQIEKQILLAESTSPDGEVIIPSILRSQTFQANVLEAQGPLSALSKTLTSFEDNPEISDIAVVSPQYATLPARRRSTRSQVYHTDVANVIFPETIDCFLDVTFNEGQKFEDAHRLNDFKWYNRSSYEKIKDAIDKIKKVFLEHGITKESDEVYLRYATCFVRGSRNQSHHDADDPMLMDKTDMEEVLPDAAIQSICGFIHSHPFQPFQLRIYCDYSSIERSFVLPGGLSSWPTTNSLFHTAIQDEYKGKMMIGRETTKGQRYLSPADNQVLVTPENAKRIIEEDAVSQRKLTPEEKTKLIKELKSRPATFLQAACVYEGLPMRFLFHLLFETPHIERKCSDNPETLRLNTPNTCDDQLCSKYYERLTEHIDKFFPEVIKLDPGLYSKDPKAIIPVRYVNKGTHLGGGGFGVVDEVDIDPHCQTLSPVSCEHNWTIFAPESDNKKDIKRTYALKEFRTRPNVKDGFDHEIRMLLDLARYLPHDHILTHITSWEQNGEYYILYEKAHGNLREHMESCEGGVLNKQRTLWFFYQLRGLSDAIRRIHFFREPDKDPITGNPWSRKTGLVGRHHDIKPENILTFDLPRDLPTLKLSDFGAGKFSNISNRDDSGPTASGNRSPRTYAGPESHRAMQADGHKVTRPYDMWALGCVFSELLLWFLGIEKPDGKSRFEDMRMQYQYNTQPEEYDYFWQREISGAFELNRAVKFVLDQLEKKWCRNMQPFQELIACVRLLLKPMPKDRIQALQLFNALDAIFIKAKRELDHAPKCYSDTYEKNMDPNTTSTELVNSGVGYLNVGRLEEDISIYSGSRTESASNLKDMNTATVAPESQEHGTAESQTHGSGSQFTKSASRPRATSSLRNDDGDEMYMEAPDGRRENIERQIRESVQNFEEQK